MVPTFNNTILSVGSLTVPLTHCRTGNNWRFSLEQRSGLLQGVATFTIGGIAGRMGFFDNSFMRSDTSLIMSNVSHATVPIINIVGKAIMYTAPSSIIRYFIGDILRKRREKI